ncbi:amine oxidase [Aspergillus sp. HF37]|nr:amine oxidase [Aspergillus sp. HF37]
MPVNDPKVHNPFGVGYTTESRIVENESGLDLDVARNRVFKIINENKINPVTGTPVGFNIFPFYSQLLLAHPYEFAEHAVWVTRHDDDELFPAGKHTMQSLGGDGLASAIKRRQVDTATETSVRNQDIVIWHTFGSTHNPRIEDWPVMPVEKMDVGFKPVNFFTGNPGVDVSQSTQERNKSVLVQSSATESTSGCCKSRL